MMLHQTVFGTSGRSHSQTHQPPVPILIFYHIRMTGTVDLVSCIVPMRQDRIMRAFFIWTVWTVRTTDGFHMAEFRAAFCDHQIVFSIYFIKMRPFRIPASASLADIYTFTQPFAGERVYLTHNDSLFSVLSLPGGCKIYFSILIKKQ